jgi:cytochrome-b5 reductase
MWTYVLRFPSRAGLASSSALAAAGLAAFASFVSSSSSSSSTASESATAAKPTPAPALSPKEFRPFRVRSVETLTPSTKRITFALDSPDQSIGLPVASLVLARAKINGKTVVRPYTPTNLNEDRGFLELVVKGYPNGVMSKYITELQPGDELEMKGPIMKLPLPANKYKQLGLIAGGSGITPMLQIVKKVCRDPTDTTQVTLLYASTSDDVVLRDELDALQYLYPQFRVFYVVDKPSDSWTGYSGFITREMIQETMPVPSDDHLVCVCGPPPMMYHVSGDRAADKTQGELQGLLKGLQYSKTQVFKF